MILDPYTKNRERNPYAVLAHVGITPDSTLQAVQDAAFTLMAQDDANGEWREAWDELRIIARRLVLDFFLYGPLQGASNEQG